MTRTILVPLVAGVLWLGAGGAAADGFDEAGWRGSADAPRHIHAHGAPVRPVSDFGFYFRDRDGFFFGYDPRDGRRWYSDWRRQYYYDRYYDQRKRRWSHDRRHYRDWHRRHYREHDRDHRYRHDHYRYDRRHDDRDYRQERRHDRGRGRGHDRHGRDDDGDNDRRRHRRD